MYAKGRGLAVRGDFTFVSISWEKKNGEDLKWLLDRLGVIAAMAFQVFQIKLSGIHLFMFAGRLYSGHQYQKQDKGQFFSVHGLRMGMVVARFC